MGKYFSIEELCKSDTAKARGINNTPSEKVKTNLELLINFILDPLRERYGKPIYVNSGYRCPALNKAVGGVANSQHLTGEAVDIDVHSKEGNKELMRLIQEMNLPYDQVIDEANLSWVHVSYSQERQRRQILKL